MLQLWRLITCSSRVFLAVSDYIRLIYSCTYSIKTFFDKAGVFSWKWERDDRERRIFTEFLLSVALFESLKSSQSMQRWFKPENIYSTYLHIAQLFHLLSFSPPLRNKLVYCGPNDFRHRQHSCWYFQDVLTLLWGADIPLAHSSHKVMIFNVGECEPEKKCPDTFFRGNTHRWNV